VDTGGLDDRLSAEVECQRGEIALEQQRAGDAARLLLSAATRLEPIDPELARKTYLEALVAALYADDADNPGGVRAAARAARAAPAPPDPPQLVDVLLDGLAVRVTKSQGAFSRAFKRTRGSSPARWRATRRSSTAGVGTARRVGYLRAEASRLALPPTLAAGIPELVRDGRRAGLAIVGEPGRSGSARTIVTCRSQISGGEATGEHV
jgi:hypothetical protein